MRIVSRQVIQDLADANWQIAGPQTREYVALLIGDRWFMLQNVADAEDEFHVEHDEVAFALSVAVGMGLEGADIVLWHSHVRTVEPSQFDLENLPEWCVAGMVYHVPSGVTTLYNGGGIIPSKVSPRISLTTVGE